MSSGVVVSSHQCPMCGDFCSPTLKLLLSHIGRVHSHSPSFSFTCGIDGCLTTLKSYASLRKHLQRKHREFLDTRSEEAQPLGGIEDGQFETSYWSCTGCEEGASDTEGDSDQCEDIKGSIASFVGDNLGSHAVGGFKEGGSALRPCRHCMITNVDLRSKVLISQAHYLNVLFFVCLIHCS